MPKIVKELSEVSIRRLKHTHNPQILFAFILSTLATFSAAQPDDISMPSSLSKTAQTDETVTDMTALSLSDMLRPASFEGGVSDFVSRIEFPEVDGDIELELLCEAGISRRGRFDWNNCFPDAYELEEEFIDSVHSASRRGRINPAQMDGRERHAFVSYRVYFKKAGQEMNVTVFPNDGMDSKALGNNYFSPQWLPRVLKASWSRCLNPKNDELPTFNIKIQKDGEISNEIDFSSHIESDQIEKCGRAVERMMQDQKFIPSFSGERFIESLWYGRMYPRNAAQTVVDGESRRAASGILAYCTNVYLDRRTGTGISGGVFRGIGSGSC